MMFGYTASDIKWMMIMLFGGAIGFAGVIWLRQFGILGETYVEFARRKIDIIKFSGAVVGMLPALILYILKD